MIVKIGKDGKSFKGLSEYLMHDPKARTEERVDWTHTHNLANDHVPSAVDEMLWTARNAELLKQEAGIRAGGRATEGPVKEVSLNWSPEDKPTREQMIATSEEFLRHMNWHEHQTLMVAHNDKPYAHVHLMINVVHPETGLHLDDGFEKRRAQAWALEYEKENGRIYCEQRLKDVSEREDAPTRPAWLAFQQHQQEFERAEKSLQQNGDLENEKIDGKITNFEEWKILKQLQKDERLEFFANGKSQFSELRKSVYREVREDFRERWSDIYESQRNGADITELKAELVADQKAVLEERRDEACKELRETRNSLYRDLLDDQRDIRLDLRSRQEAGFENALFLQQVEERASDKAVTAAFRETANELTMREEERNSEAASMPFSSRPERDSSGVKSGTNIGLGVGEGIGTGLVSLLDGLADGLVWSKPDPKPRRQETPAANDNHFTAAADDARKQQTRDKENADRDDWYRKQRSLSGE